MAIIYGSPAILWPKPDTSEEWLINATPDIYDFFDGQAGAHEYNVSFISNGESYEKINLSSY